MTSLRLRETVGLADAADLLQDLTTQARPLTALATSIAGATDLAGPGASGGVLDGIDGLPFDPLAAPDPFAPLRRLLAAEGEEPPLAVLDTALDELSSQLARATAMDPRAAEVAESGGALAAATQEVGAVARPLPSPLDTLLLGLAGEISETVTSRARDALSDLWTGSIAPQCVRAVSGRYPFDAGAEVDVALTDFTRVFAPGGLFDAFFETHLESFVDRSGDDWAWSGGLGVEGDTSDALRQFQNAAAIRDAFFPPGAAEPRIDVTFELVRLDGAEGVVIQFGRDRAFVNPRGIGNSDLIWPAETAGAVIYLLPGTQDPLRAGGPWAAFRLLEAGERRTLNANTFEATFRSTGRGAARGATIRITAGSVNNPFDLPAIAAFDCPRTLLQ